MSSQTPNLNLVLPVGTEHVSRQIINDNNTKIDTAVGANSQAIAKLDSNANSTNDILADAVSCTKTTFFNGSGGSYTGSVPDANYKWATFMVNVKASSRNVIAQAPQGTVAINSYGNGAWSGWQELATNSKIANTGAWYELMGSKNANGDYSLSDSYENYKSIVVMLFGSSNSISSGIFPTTMLITAGYKPTISSGSDKVTVTFTSTTTVTVSNLTGSVRIYGLK